jgi:hypothetical protein
MHLKRLEVEEGFLDGLVLDFDEGLNVLIGGRGVGKTAVIELVRYCLGISNIDSAMSQESITHATGVLSGGLATLTVEHDGETHQFSRASGEKLPRSHLGLPPPLVLSQREIESLARTPSGRLNLLDSFIAAPVTLEKVPSARVKSLSAEIRDLCNEIDEIDEELEKEAGIVLQLNALKRQQAALGTGGANNKNESFQIDLLQGQSNQISVEQQVIERVQAALSRWQSVLDSALSLPPINISVSGATPRWLAEIKDGMDDDRKSVSELRARSVEFQQRAESALTQLITNRLPIEDQLRKRRQILEAQQQGAGKVAREISLIEERLARLKSMRSLRNTKSARANDLHDDRRKQLALLEEWREDKFARRQKVASELSRSLKPRIRISVGQSADVSHYDAAIREMLRGSNLKYNELAATLAQAVSPAELCEFSFNGNSQELADVLGVSVDRASRLIAVLRVAEIENALTADLEDQVTFCLLDGSTYKDVEELSIGQRCTVVLSIVFENTSVVLIVDQPEDHLDNEFVADTLIRAILSREGVAQTVLASHNANIPVLGNAAQVVHLESNGQRGYVKLSGSLADLSVVESVVTVMEGGVEAFDRRATFYKGSRL